MSTEILSKNDTKDRITPVAFAPDNRLFDLPLARPWRRGGAMLCDLMIVAVLTAMDDVFLISLLLVVWLLHKAKQWRLLGVLGRYGVWAIRGGSLLIIIAGFYASSVLFLDNDSTSDDDSKLVGDLAMNALGALHGSQCQTAECWQEILEPIVDESLKSSDQLNALNPVEFVETFTENSELIKEEKEKLIQWAKDNPKWKVDDVVVTSPNSVSDGVPANSNSNNTTTDSSEPSARSEASSPMQWIMGIIDDLGLGFGFAAIYFTCFTAWFNGQTLGKMLFNTRVLQLSNEPMGLWDAFGRYGGYGAGLATGLLGFFQIYWDANRQAIQDKISATVVVDLTLAAKEKKLVVMRQHEEIIKQNKEAQAATSALSKGSSETPPERLEN
ncbi:RDD family protein [Psychrobium sp. nBUS_13]|uniref:RDD family protein n=1 Tax=Psychrobium sp. nBUS_13 TaxID=3395319 RepID=UPI003EBF44B2